MNSKIILEKNKIDLTLRRKFFLKNFDARNKFEKYLQENLKNYIPYSLLECYGEIKNFLKKLNYVPRIICTATAFNQNDLFNVWAAEMYLKKCKLIFIDHGSYLVEKLNYDDWETKFDNFATWKNWSNKKKKNFTQLPCQILKKNKSKDRILNSNKIVFSYLNQSKYFFRFRNGPFPSDNLSDLTRIKFFYKKLDNQLKKNLYMRNPFNDVWKNNLFFKKYGIKISQEKNIYEDFQDSRISIINYPETVFIQSLHFNIPTILILDKKFWHIPKRYLTIFKNLEKNKIIFYDPFKAASHVNKIYDNPLLWWNNHETSKSINYFLKEFCLTKKNTLSHWSEYFVNQL